MLNKIQGRKAYINIVVGLVGILCGISLFMFSNHIVRQVAIGRGEIAQGQTEVNILNGLIDQTTTMKGLGSLFTSPAQNKINKGRQEANYYEKLAGKLQVWGLVIILVSSLFLMLSLFVRKSKI